MAHQVPWTNKRMEFFIKEASLSEDEAFIIRTRVKGWSVTQQALELNKSVPTIHRMISKLKIKYDHVQEEYPDELPKRKSSAKETWMDTH